MGRKWSLIIDYDIIFALSLSSSPFLPFLSLYSILLCHVLHYAYIHVHCNNCSIYWPVDYIKHLDEQSMDKDDSESKNMLIYIYKCSKYFLFSSELIIVKIIKSKFKYCIYMWFTLSYFDIFIIFSLPFRGPEYHFICSYTRQWDYKTNG